MIDTRSYVSFVETAELRIMKVCPDAYTYIPQRGWAWLQRLAIRVLKWRRCHHMTNATEYRRVDVPKTGLLDAVARQHAALRGQLNGQPAVLLIGPDDFSEAMRAMHRNSDTLMFRTIRIDTDGYWYDHPASRVSLPIVVVPWMRGVLLVPKALLQ